MCSFDAITGIVLKTNRRTMDFIRHMRRPAFFPGRPGGLTAEITCRLSENSEKIWRQGSGYGIIKPTKPQ